METKETKKISLVFLLQVFGYLVFFGGMIYSWYYNKERAFLNDFPMPFYIIGTGLLLLMIAKGITIFKEVKNSDSKYEKYAGITLFAAFLITLLVYYYYQY